MRHAAGGIQYAIELLSGHEYPFGTFQAVAFTMTLLVLLLVPFRAPRAVLVPMGLLVVFGLTVLIVAGVLLLLFEQLLQLLLLLRGQRVARMVRRGEPLTADLLEPGEYKPVPSGYRAVSIRTRIEKAVAHVMVANVRIDLSTLVPDDKDRTRRLSVIFLQDIQVLAVRIAVAGSVRANSRQTMSLADSVEAGIKVGAEAWATSGRRAASSMGILGQRRDGLQQEGDVGLARQAMVAVLDQRELHIG